MSEPGAPSPYEPYGNNPYGSPYGGAPVPGAPPAGQQTDPVSIVGFVLSLLCCTSLIGLVLGIVGLGRTKGGVRSGRWAAICAVAIGAVGTLAGVAMLAFFVWFGTSTVSLSNADVGQCVNVDEFSDGHDATLFEKDCDEAHEAEIAVSDEFTRDEVEAFDRGGSDAVCVERLDTDYRAAYAENLYELEILFEASDPEAGDDYLCYLSRLDGDDLEEPIVD